MSLKNNSNKVITLSKCIIIFSVLCLVPNVLWFLKSRRIIEEIKLWIGIWNYVNEFFFLENFISNPSEKIFLSFSEYTKSLFLAKNISHNLRTLLFRKYLPIKWAKSLFDKYFPQELIMQLKKLL